MITRVGLFVAAAFAISAASQSVDGQTSPVAHFDFDRVGAASASSFVRGLEGESLSLGSGDEPTFWTLPSDVGSLGTEDDFSLRFWIKTDAEADRRFVLLSQKEFADNSLASQKNAGWVFYMSNGSWAFSVGSGTRRLTYERDNGLRMPLNDGRWHQLAMTYSAEMS